MKQQLLRGCYQQPVGALCVFQGKSAHVVNYCTNTLKPMGCHNLQTSISNTSLVDAKLNVYTSRNRTYRRQRRHGGSVACEHITEMMEAVN